MSPILTSVWLACLLGLLLVATCPARVKSESQVFVYIVALYGANEAGTPGDPSATGNATITIDGLAGTLLYDIECSGIQSPTGADLNFGNQTLTGGAGTAGSAATVVALTLVNTVIQSYGDGRYSITGKVPVTSDMISGITKDPQDYYVQVYTWNYAYGAMRGQLATVGGTAQVTFSDANYEDWNDIFP